MGDISGAYAQLRKRFDVNLFFEWTPRQFPVRATWVFPRIVCEDGFSMSVQAGPLSRSTLDTGTNTYTHVEVGFPSEFESLIQDNIASNVRVFGYVPVDTVNKIVEKHGGFVGLDTSNVNSTPEIQEEESRFDKIKKGLSRSKLSIPPMPWNRRFATVWDSNLDRILARESRKLDEAIKEEMQKIKPRSIPMMENPNFTPVSDTQIGDELVAIVFTPILIRGDNPDPDTVLIRIKMADIADPITIRLPSDNTNGGNYEGEITMPASLLYGKGLQKPKTTQELKKSILNNDDEDDGAKPIQF